MANHHNPSAEELGAKLEEILIDIQEELVKNVERHLPERLYTETEVCVLLGVKAEYLHYRFIDSGLLSQPIDLNAGTGRRPMNRWPASEVSHLIDRLKAGDLEEAR